MAKKSKKDEVVEVVDLIPAANEKMKASDEERKTSQEIVDGLKRQKVESWDSKVTFNIEGDAVPIAKMEPKVFFDNVKTMKHETSSEVMKIFYENALKKLNRYRITRQIDAAKKILFYMKVMEKEIDLIDRGVNTFIYVQDILNYIDHVDNKSICITTIDRYEREIPDEIIDKMEILNELGYPVLLGTSRKSVIGLTLDLPVTQREEGTMVTTVYGVQKGCAFVRVHDVEKNKRAIQMTKAIMRGHEV